VSENIGAEILSNWYCVRNSLKERLLLNFAAIKFEDEWKECPGRCDDVRQVICCVFIIRYVDS